MALSVGLGASLRVFFAFFAASSVSFSFFSRSSSSCLFLCDEVRIIFTSEETGIATHLESFPAFPCLLLFLLTFKFLSSLLLRRSQDDVLSEEAGIVTYLELLLELSGILLFLLAFEFPLSPFFLQWNWSDVPAEEVGSQRTSNFSLSSLAFFSSFSRSTLFCLSSFCGRVRITSCRGDGGQSVPRALPCVLWSLSLPSHVQVPLVYFPPSIKSKRCSVGRDRNHIILRVFPCVPVLPSLSSLAQVPVASFPPAVGLE